MPRRTALSILAWGLVPLALSAPSRGAEPLRIDLGDMVLEVYGDAGSFEVLAQVAAVGPALEELTDTHRSRAGDPSAAVDPLVDILALSTAIREEDGRIYSRVDLFTERHQAVTDYQLILRLDRWPVPFHQAVREVAAWWAGRPGYEPAPVPEIARLPMYSTWYSYHQSLVAEEILADLAVAKELGPPSGLLMLEAVHSRRQPWQD